MASKTEIPFQRRPLSSIAIEKHSVPFELESDGSLQVKVTKNEFFLLRMEQNIFKIVNNCLNTNIYSYLKTSGGQSSNLYLNVVHFFNTSVN